MFKKKNAQQPQEESQVNARGEAVFAALDQSRKAKKRKRVRTIVTIVVILALVLLVGTGILRQRVREQFASSGDDVIRAQAERGTISTVVSGSGMLLNVDTETVTVPSGVEVTEILVEYGDRVAEKDLLAVVDMASVRTAMATLQEEIQSLDKKITAAENETVDTYVSAGVPGRVKQIYGQVGDRVENVMVEHGGLVLISLDGYMALDVVSEALQEWDVVTVTLSDGTQKSGTVDAVVGSRATILISDDGPVLGDQVTVTRDGEKMGEGELYVHNPLRVTGYAGTIHTVNAQLNQQVYPGSTMFTLRETSTSASYDALLRSRSEKEETLLELLQIQRAGGLSAPIGGSVYSVADLDSEEETEITDIVTLSPDVSMSVTISVDESDILSLALGQEADVTVSSVSDEVLTGTVTEIDKTDSSGAYTAVITLDKQEGMIPGMTASVDVRIEGVDNAILIPADALHQTSAGYYVYTTYDEQTRQYGGKVDVIPGLSNSDYVEIKSGLKEGDTVWYVEQEDFFSMFGMGFGGGMPGGMNGSRPGGMSASGGSRPGGMGGSGGMPSDMGGGMPGGMGGRG